MPPDDQREVGADRTDHGEHCRLPGCDCVGQDGEDCWVVLDGHGDVVAAHGSQAEALAFAQPASGTDRPIIESTFLEVCRHFDIVFDA
jgi:hypothetical protein